MAHVLAVVTSSDITDATLYLRTGAVNVGLVALIVEGLITLVKPFYDRAFNPATDPRHDPAIELTLLALTVAGVVMFQAVGPLGLNSGADVAALVVQVILALFTEWGVYLKTRGPVPVTPTAGYVAKLVDRHGAILTAALQTPYTPPEPLPIIPPAPGPADVPAPEPLPDPIEPVPPRPPVVHPIHPKPTPRPPRPPKPPPGPPEKR